MPRTSDSHCRTTCLPRAISALLPGLALLAFAVAASAQQGDVAGQAQPPLPADLVVPPAPVLSPEDALAAFEVPAGLTVQLVAAEPLVNDPVMATFDLQGRLWVVEMTGYMPDADGTGEADPVGTVAVLHDDDGDGRMDRRVVFLDELVLPRSVAPTRDGALVITPPDVLFCRDTDGDGRADTSEVVDTGLGGIASPEHAPNGLLPTLDNTFAVANHRARYRFVEGAWAAERTPHRGQWGITQDDVGRLYFNTNSDPLRVDLVPSTYSLRHPIHGGVAGVNAGVSCDRGAWPSRITPGVNRGYQEQTLRDDWTLRNVTAACAPWVFRGDGLRPEDKGSVFVCEPSGNLVQRYQLLPRSEQGLRAVNPHAASKRDFLTSTDERFRPVQLTGGPDGALYVVDMYRGILQHRIFMTSWLRAQVLERGLDTPVGLGRIWRVVRSDGGGETPAGDRSTPQGLLTALESPSGWWRDRAQQELVEQHADDETVIAALRARLALSASPAATPSGPPAGGSPAAADPPDSAPPLTRLHALWILDGMDALSADDVRVALNDIDPRLRRAGAELSERWLGTRRDLVKRLAELDSDESLDVRIQALLSLGASPSTACTRALAEGITTDASSPERRSAVLSALSGREVAFLDHLLADSRWAEPLAGRDVFLELLSRNLGRTRATDAVGAVLDGAFRPDAASWQRVALLKGLLAARPADALGHPGRIPLATRPAAWLSLNECTDTEAAELSAALLFPGHPIPDDRPVVRALTSEEQEAFEHGQALYAIACARCHQPSGQGQAGLAPPLVSSPWVLGEPERLARILLQGLSGPVTVRGTTWDLDMPALAGSDAQLAAVLSYIRREWGHGAEPIGEDLVRRMRADTDGRDEPWTVAELEALAED